MTFTLMITLNVVLDVALLAVLAFVMARAAKLTPHQPGVSGNRWRIRRPLRHQVYAYSRGEREPLRQRREVFEQS
ncbi:MAG: hypothetical protein JWN10_1679 [Solirubrobacterales bacterium]|nr:hypothetical protein [Solirubrobacterales bacterium]